MGHMTLILGVEGAVSKLHNRHPSGDIISHYKALHSQMQSPKHAIPRLVKSWCLPSRRELGMSARPCKYCQPYESGLTPCSTSLNAMRTLHRSRCWELNNTCLLWLA